MAIKNRLHRSELAVPGTNLRMLEKAPDAGADLVFLDLEDAVAPNDKAQARKNVISALNELDWSNTAVSVRINGLDTEYMYQDLVAVMEQAGDKLDTILIPKVNSAADVHLVATIMSQIELGKKFAPVNLHVLIETAEGMANIESIARACPERMEAMVFGVADYAASIRARTTQIGGANPLYGILADQDATQENHRQFYWGDPWHYALSRLVVACRANGLRPIDGPYGAIDDPQGFEVAARAGAALGIEGKWAIHPSQIPLANTVFTPAAEEVRRAQRILDAMKQAALENRGAVSLDGRLIDAASIRQAEVVIAQQQQIESQRAATQNLSAAL